MAEIELLEEKLFRLTVNGRTMFGEKSHYRPGELAVLNIPLATDVNTSVTCDSTDIGRGIYSAGILRFEFIMPPHDVNVNYRTYGSMMRMPSSEPQTLSMADVGNLFQCPECRHVCRKSDNYCTECGRKLK